jgi:hypothetical protein
VPAEVFWTAGATAIAVEAGEWIGAARFQRTALHIAIGHAFSIALSRVKFEGLCHPRRVNFFGGGIETDD